MFEGQDTFSEQTFRIVFAAGLQILVIILMAVIAIAVIIGICSLFSSTKK